MHPDIIATCARLHAADLARQASDARRLAVRRRPLRARIGLALVRAGTRLSAPAPAGAPRVTLAR